MSRAITIRFSKEEAAWVEREAARRNLTASEVLRQALRHEIANVVTIDRLNSLEARMEEMREIFARDFEAMGRINLKILKTLEARC